MTRLHKLAASLALACVALPCFARPICDLVPQASVEALIGLKVAEKQKDKGMMSESCTYLTTPSTNGQSLFIIERYTVNVRPGGEAELLMRDQDNNAVALPGLGDLALMENSSHELLIRRGNGVVKIIARGIACEEPAPGEDRTSARERCDRKRVGILKQAAGLVLRAI